MNPGNCLCSYAVYRVNSKVVLSSTVCKKYDLIVYKKFFKLVDECRRYSKPKQCRFQDMVYRMTEKTISGVHVSPGSAETLVRRGGITNHHMTAYCLSSISAKNCQNWLMCIEVIVCNISVVF